MYKQWILVAFDCEGNKIKRHFDFEQGALNFAKEHGLEIFSLKYEWVGVSI